MAPRITVSQYLATLTFLLPVVGPSDHRLCIPEGIVSNCHYCTVLIRKIYFTAFSLAPEASPIALTQWKASVFFFFQLEYSCFPAPGMLEKTEGRRRRRCQQMRWLDRITEAMNMNLGKLQGMMRDRRPGMLQSMGSQRFGHDWVTEQQQHSCLTC